MSRLRTTLTKGIGHHQQDESLKCPSVLVAFGVVGHRLRRRRQLCFLSVVVWVWVQGERRRRWKVDMVQVLRRPAQKATMQCCYNFRHLHNDCQRPSCVKLRRTAGAQLMMTQAHQKGTELFCQEGRQYILIWLKSTSECKPCSFAPLVPRVDAVIVWRRQILSNIYARFLK